jgi:lysophospholipase L1-like esterase
MSTKKFAAGLALTLSAAIALSPANAGEQWTASWYASPQSSWGPDFALPTGVPAMLERQTVRETARISVGGKRVRVVLSNRYGTQPLVIGEAHIARAASTPEGPTEQGAIAAASDRALTFGGQRGAVIAPGAPLISDPLDMPVASLERLTVSIYLPQATPLTTFHWGAQQTGRIAAGNVAAERVLKNAQPLQGRALLSGILVDAEAAPRLVVAFGDSITDGNGSTPDRDHRWPDYLAEQLSAQGIAVVNAGISGARLLGDAMGRNAAARFEQDVVAQPGVKTVLVLLGINDIGWPQTAFAPNEQPMTSERMIAAYRQLIAQSRTHGIRIVGATLPPFEGALQDTPLAGYWTPAKDAVRREVNRWIRDGGEFDAVVDIDGLLRDAGRPSKMQARFDSGDHLHPGDTGYQAIAAAMQAVVR